METNVSQPGRKPVSQPGRKPVSNGSGFIYELNFFFGGGESIFLRERWISLFLGILHNPERVLFN